MQHYSVTDLFPAQVATAAISDGSASLNGVDLRLYLAAIDDAFRRQGGHDASCMAIIPENRVSGLLLILYCLHKKINCHLLSPYRSPGAAIPSFCDMMLTMPANDGTTLSPGELNAGIKLTACNSLKNPDLTTGEGLFVFSSSGSTGKPKYVVWRSGRLLENAAACALRFGMTPDARVLIPVPVSHMFGLGAGLLPALIAGSEIRLIGKNNVVRLWEQLCAYNPDYTLVTPTICRMLLLLGKRLPGERSFITAGEKLRRDLYIDFESTFGSLTNLYGCTEMGAIATSDAADNLADRATGVVRPIGRVSLDIDGMDSGELICRHPSSFSRYIDEQGAAVYPLPDDSFRTRDLANRSGPDRYIIAGRLDNSLNRSGFLVSLQEVESALEELFMEISQAVVLENDTETLAGMGLTAVCELKPGARLNGETIRKACIGRMQRHHIPDQFVFTTELPRLASGKPDRVLIREHFCPRNGN